MALALVPLAAFFVSPAMAGAEEQPAILKAYDLDWIERVRDDAWPQPKSQRPVICLLDTGVDVTPDTPADNPDGPIVARLALDGGTGLAQGTSWEHQHGTQMASIIAAPRNGFGTVGVFPQARIVSIRVTDKTQEEVYITPGAVAQGVRRCARWAEESDVRVAAVVMAESNYDQRIADIGAWSDAAATAREFGALLVAAAGNEPDADLVAPIAVPNTLAVSAGDETGAACAFVAGIQQTGAIRGPGCAASGWIAGSSSATAVVGAFVAAIASREPAGSPAALQQRIAAAVSPAAGSSGRLSGTSTRVLFGGLISDLPPADIATPAAGAAMNDSVRSDDAATTDVKARLWRPRVRVTWKRGRLYVKRVSRRAGMINLRLGLKSDSRVVSSSRMSFRVDANSKPRVVELWASSASGNWRSLSTRCRVD